MPHELQRELNRETEAASPQFSELLNLAVSTMLSDPEHFDACYEEARTHYSQSDLSEIVNSLGLWAIDSVLESGKELDQSLMERFESSEVLLLPLHTDIQAQIEGLGQSIMDEAFNCLGEDAAEQVSVLQEAKTDEERVQVMGWLIGRIKAIEAKFAKALIEPTPLPRAPDQLVPPEQIMYQIVDHGPERFYHPVRLSPKVIGEYPDVMVEPTCLGYSILIASFFEKAGVPFMHSGVVKTASEEARSMQSSLFGLIIKTSIKEGVDLPYDKKYEYKEAGKKNWELREDHSGFHAAVLARLSDTLWYHFDPNYETTIPLLEPMTIIMDDHYAELERKNSVARGLENMSGINPGLPIQMGHNLLAIEFAKQFPKVEDIEELLITKSVLTFKANFIEKYFSDFFSESEDLKHEWLEIICRLHALNTRIERHEFFSDTINGVIEDYVFNDEMAGDLYSCLKRCHTDAGYRRRVAEMLAWTPLFSIARMQSQLGNRIIGSKATLPHSQLDSGLPAYRIGMSVLSDLAVYSGDDLPLSFWMTYWPSQVSFVDHYNNASSSTPAQVKLKEQIAAHLKGSLLKYGVVDGIVRDVLE